METNIEKGFTFIYAHEDDGYNIQYTKDTSLYEIMNEFREFLLASGFSQNGIDEYMDLE